MAARIPDKLYFRIGEVANIASLRPSVLRFWETEFDLLQPIKSRSGQRLYTRKELELILEIKKLLYSDKLTIEGARKKLRQSGKSGGHPTEDTCFPDEQTQKILHEIKNDLMEIKYSLLSDVT